MLGRRTVLVAGGGISGLVAARDLSKDHKVIIVESSSHLGGKLCTGQFRGRAVELGPDSFLARRSTAVALCEELGLGSDLIAPTASGASIYARNRLRKMPLDLALGVPTSLFALVRSRVLPATAIVRSACDLLLPSIALSAIPPGTKLNEPVGDPTVGQVIGGRLGRQVLDSLVGPLIAGIHAGDVDELSFSAAAPELAKAITGRSSIIKALRPIASAQRQQSRNRARATSEQPLDSGRPRSVFVGLQSGFSSLIQALTNDLLSMDATIQLNTSVRGVTPLSTVRSGPDNSAWNVELAGNAGITQTRSQTVDAIVLATPAWATGPVLQSAGDNAATLAEISAICQAIPYASVALVTFAWPSQAIPELSGTGFLVPRKSGHIVTAVTNLSAKWPHMPIEGEVWLRASVGHHNSDAATSLDDEELISRTLNEVKQIIGISTEPLDAMVTRWPNAFPQYISGHLANMALLDRDTALIGTLALTGSAYHGIGIPACIADGHRAASQVAAALAD